MSSSNARPPWAYLVDDVLQQIFLLSTINSNTDIGRFGCSQSSIHKLPQLSISHVCSTWGHVALLTPRLWNRIHIRDTVYTRMAKAKEWLSRARNTPVSITVCVYISDNDFDAYCSSLLLFLSSYRIEHLDLRFNKFFPYQNLSARNVGDLEMLMMDFDPADHTCVKLNLSQYPKLSQLSVFQNCNLLGTSDSLLKLDIPYSRLSVWEFLDILSSCPLLEEFTVSLVGHDRGKSSMVKNLYLPHLRILWFPSWAEGTGIQFASVIDPLTLPHLQKFQSDHSATYWSTPAFGALVKRSNGILHLTYLYLDKLRVTVDAGVIISLIPSITVLGLCTSSIGCRVIFDTDTLTRLAIGSLGPQLKELIIGHMSNPHEFMDMVKSRTENAEECDDGTFMGFRRVLFDTRGCDEGVFSHLSKLQESGIPIDNY